MKKKYMLILAVITILLLGIITFGVGYYKYSKNVEEDNEDAVVKNENNLSINYTTGDEFNIKKLSDGYSLEKKFSVTNMGETSLYYMIELDSISYNIKSEGDLTFTLEGNNGIKKENIEFPEDASILCESIAIAPSTTQSYTLKIKYKGSANATDSVSGRINVTITDEKNQTFADLILLNNQITNYQTEPGKNISTTNEGLIKSEDEDGTTYYFRGSADKNYVLFADYTWRIVRINGDGTIRLILDDEVDSFPYNLNELEEGRTDYYTLAEYRNSSLKKELDFWYERKLSNYGVNIVESKFCSDTNISDKEKNDAYYNTYSRVIIDQEPTFMCKGEEYTSTIGLLSLDELVFAGASANGKNKSFYLNKDDIAFDWWLGSPSMQTGEETIKVFSFNANNGAINLNSDITTSLGIRPVISLRNNITVTGTGTEEDPYVIQ